MDSLAEIQIAAIRLPPGERQKLLLEIAQSLRAEREPLPEPRRFSPAEMRGWMDEDEQDMKRFKGQG